MTRFSIMLGLSLTVASAAAVADDNPANGEVRCDELGANCICAEALNTSDYDNFGTYYKNPADSTSKECTMEGQAGSPVAINTNARGQVSNQATAMSALPAGNDVEFFLKTPDGGNGIFFVGNDDLGSQYNKRAAVRFYLYYSPDYQFAQEGSCTNNKLMQIEGMPVDQSFGKIHMYAFTSIGHSYDNNSRNLGDCCFTGPPDQSAPGVGNTTKNDMRGNWHRFEWITTNRSGGASPNGIVYQLYWKNITQNTPELKVIDTGMPCPTCGPEPDGLGTDDLTPGKRIDKQVINLYREGTCNGFRGISHVVYAGWDSDLGQRIGSALEVEGVAGALDPNINTKTPNPPVFN